MNSTWMSKLTSWWKGRKSVTTEGVRGANGEENAPNESERVTDSHARSRRIGFFRFYGQRAVDGLRRVYGRRGDRTPLQRSMVVVTAVLVVGGGYAGWAGILQRPEPIQTDLTDGLWESSPVEFAELLPGSDFPGTTDSVELAEGDPEVGTAATLEAAEPAEPAQPATADLSDSTLLALALDPRGSQAEADGLDRTTLPSPSPSESRPSEDSAAPGTSQSPQPPTVSRPQASLPPVSVTSMVLPVSGEVIQPYGWYRHPVFGDWRHTSSVVLKPDEDGLVRAALAGRVRDVVYEGGIWRVHIEHSGGWSTEYSGLLDVEVGSYQVVDTGQVIGQIDPHVGWGVSFAVRQGEVAVNPMSLINQGALPASTN